MYTQPEEDEQCRQAYTKALALQADIRQQTRDMLQQEDVSKYVTSLARTKSGMGVLSPFNYMAGSLPRLRLQDSFSKPSMTLCSSHDMNMQPCLLASHHQQACLFIV